MVVQFTVITVGAIFEFFNCFIVIGVVPGANQENLFRKAHYCINEQVVDPKPRGQNQRVDELNQVIVFYVL